MNIATPTIIPFTMPTLSKGDQNFIEFTRCLYKAKLVVQELEEFSNIVESHTETHEFIKQINQYLDESFRKFYHMCRVLLVILQKLESNHPVKRERIESYRYEVLQEWKKTIIIKQNLIYFLQREDGSPSN
jgi:hypothetical protein